MKCIVPIKRVIDPYVNIRVKSDNSGVETNNVKMAINPFDEIAIEEAVRLKEQGIVTNICVVSIGVATILQETLRQALARGADTAVIINIENQNPQLKLEPFTTASILRNFIMQQEGQLVLIGKQAIDDDNNQTGQILAALLGWPQATFASKITMEHNSVTVVREIDGGLETLKLTLPAVITTDLRLNEPRYISLPNVMQAKRKPLEVKTLQDFGVEPSTLIPTIEVLEVTPPKPRLAGIKVNNVAELIEKLKSEAKVL